MDEEEQELWASRLEAWQREAAAEAAAEAARFAWMRQTIEQLIAVAREQYRGTDMGIDFLIFTLESRRPAPPAPTRRTKAPIPQALRWQVWERDDFTCKWCGTRRRLSIDHVVPESKGGATIISNLQTLCSSCNSRKGAR